MLFAFSHSLSYYKHEPFFLLLKLFFSILVRQELHLPSQLSASTFLTFMVYIYFVCAHSQNWKAWLSGDKTI